MDYFLIPSVLSQMSTWLFTLPHCHFLSDVVWMMTWTVCRHCPGRERERTALSKALWKLFIFNTIHPLLAREECVGKHSYELCVIDAVPKCVLSTFTIYFFRPHPLAKLLLNLESFIRGYGGGEGELRVSEEQCLFECDFCSAVRSVREGTLFHPSWGCHSQPLI